ncbi:MAG: glycosyltransferase family 4 protein [Lentisphaeria bacterium]|nr:glycosyltransferase family 4 protein [Candidatus Neomarinimicrobiota bacterium]MCF7841821.1 glycosyltransferase family 4 protein [Lentisphaeria bacterium]
MTVILMLLQTNFPPDIRVENEIDSLTEAGHEVHLICQNKGDEPEQERWQAAFIHRIPTILGNTLLGKIMQAPIFLNPLWLWYINKIGKRFKIKIIHVHDLPLTPMAMIFKAFRRVKIIYDMHENYPAALSVWNKQGLERLLKNYWIAELIERRAARLFDHFIAVIEENKTRFIRDHGVLPGQISIVSNLVVLSKYKPETSYDEFTFPADKHVLIYTGGLDLHRGLGLTLSMFKLLAQIRKDVYLLVVGGGRSAAGKVEERKLIDEIKTDSILHKSVHITGWVDFKYLPWLVQQSKICLLPQESNPHTDTTIPHKLFQYMAMAKPVVAADAVPVKRIIEKTGAGVIFPSGDAKVYAAIVDQLLSSSQAVHYGDQGRKAVIAQYNWDIAAEKLIGIYQEIFEGAFPGNKF